MEAIYIMLVLWAYNLFLITTFFCAVLERRKSVRIIVLGTMLYYVIICLLRLPAFWYTGLKYLSVLNILTQILFFIYQILFFKGSIQKRVLSIVFLMVFMSMIELIAGRLAYVITGIYDIVNFHSKAYNVVCWLCFPLTTISIYPFVRLWNVFQKIKWEGDKKIWLCVVLPISQYLILESLLENYGQMRMTVSVLVLSGIILQGGGNFYMFALFYRENQKIQAEKKLRLEQELYRKEQIYYETLKENQKETARIRHDFQNYILVFKNIAQKKEDGV